MRATIETHESSNDLPPVQVLVSLGDEDMSIRVSCTSYTHTRTHCVVFPFAVASIMISECHSAVQNGLQVQ